MHSPTRARGVWGHAPPENFDKNGAIWCNLGVPKYEGRFYVRREVDLMKTAKVNAYIMHVFRKIELLSVHAT